MSDGEGSAGSSSTMVTEMAMSAVQRSVFERPRAYGFYGAAPPHHQYAPIPQVAGYHPTWTPAPLFIQNAGMTFTVSAMPVPQRSQHRYAPQGYRNGNRFHGSMGAARRQHRFANSSAGGMSHGSMIQSPSMSRSAQYRPPRPTGHTKHTVVYPDGETLEITIPSEDPTITEREQSVKAEDSLNRLLNFGYRRINFLCKTHHPEFQLNKDVPTEPSQPPSSPPPPEYVYAHVQVGPEPIMRDFIRA